MPTDPLADFYLGEVLSARYEVLEFVGSGGFCLVYRALDRDAGTEVALKILRPGVVGSGVLEFETEGLLLDRFRRSLHVVTLLGTVSNSDTIMIQKPGMPAKVPFPVRYLVLELAEGTLADVAANRGAITWAERLDLLRDLVVGVHQLHLGDVVHRDVKAENVLLCSGPKRVIAKVADLGRGRDLNEAARYLVDDYIQGRGDLRFAPPELLSLIGTEDGTCFRRSDLFLLGSGLFELATGQGITAMAYGDPRSVLHRAVGIDAARRRTDYEARLSETRAVFEPVFDLFSQEVPPVIRTEATRLVRQLCDPDPPTRERRTRAERNQETWGLQWLIRRIDILRHLESVERRQPGRYRRKVS